MINPDREQPIQSTPPRPRTRDDLSHNYPPEARALIKQSHDIQHGLRAVAALGKGWSDADFTSGYSALGSNVWFQLQAGTYPWPKTASGSARLLKNVSGLVAYGDEWRRKQAHAALMASVKPVGASFVRFPEYDKLLKAIDRAKARVPDAIEERLVIVVGPSRSGKSMMFRKLLEDRVATWAITATPSWRTSYYAMLEAIHVQALGCEPPRRNGPSAETKLKSYFGGQAGVMEVIELQNICPASLEFLKGLLNDTTLVLVWFMTPKNFNRLLLADGDDLDDRCQLLARSAEVVHIGAESPATVMAMGPQLWAGLPPTDDRLQVVADAANDLGCKSLLRVISKSLSSVTKNRRPPTMTEVEEALKAYRLCVPVPTLSRRPYMTSKAA